MFNDENWDEQDDQNLWIIWITHCAIEEFAFHVKHGFKFSTLWAD